ncbi:DUF3052 domain-containing protein [Arsenicicoccus sp. oral taxon 190]|uniref:DUF3052 domain-containing protein n=1 Tax=Arsenicicoccus sp. oral taxon 190 TaxID=1658671 RepID=UPI00067A14EC|nr:DUF3052 domain-containing protein [Arsenicicoccus sp. oral taxon 190]AKT52122.1 hypothetical protein ADJ73_14080 [Arsenicicoccus sp. oral taxon 190]
MTPTAEAAAAAAHLTKLGLTEGTVVQELGYDDDVDLDLREQLMDHIGGDLVDGDHGDVVDAVLLWYRDGDDDLVDAIVDALTDLEDQGFILLMSPRAGRPGEVEPSDIAEAAGTAGLHVSGALTGSRDWAGARLVPARTKRR